MAKLPSHLLPVVEKICAQGCQRVKQTIQNLNQDQPLEATEQLDTTERDLILQELQSIMAVYNQSQKLKSL